MTEPSRTEPTRAETSPQTSDRKAALRQRLLAARASVDATWRASASAAITATVQTLPEVAASRNTLGYAAFGTEVDIDALLRSWIAAGVAVHLPFVDGEDLGIAVVGDLDADLAPGWGGVREPDPAHRVPADPAVLDVAVVPGVGFDRAGHRLGYGGGHFDRLLARLAPGSTIIGVAFSTQVVTQLPSDDHDIGVDVLVTEDGVLRLRD